MRSHALSAIILIALTPLLTGATGRRPAVLLAAGDISDCVSHGDRLTAKLISRLPGTVAALGDTACPDGKPSEFQKCYAPTWGRFKNRTRPALGNHEYGTGNADTYFAYFGAKAAPPGGYYSYELGSWHVIVVNSNCDPAGGCDSGSPQLKWLQADLRAHPQRCTLAYWHHPRFSSGPHGSNETMQPIWATLAKAGAEVVLNGHDHMYERFTPIDAKGNRDPKRGMREFIVGTGGAGLYPWISLAYGSEKTIAFRFGVLRLELSSTGYSWRFLSAPDGRVLDSGKNSCH